MSARGATASVSGWRERAARVSPGDRRSSSTPRCARLVGAHFAVSRRLTIPDHKERRKGTLRALSRQAGLSVEEFVALQKE
jgi:hypothetical protein